MVESKLKANCNSNSNSNSELKSEINQQCQNNSRSISQIAARSVNSPTGLLDLSLGAYMSALGSSSPTPGGGCAAGISALQAIGLFKMVAELTRDCDETVRIVSRLNLYAERSRGIAEADMAAFSEVMRCMKLAKSTENERSVRSKLMDSALKSAAQAPLDLLILSEPLLTVAERLVEVGNSNVLSDIGNGLYLLEAVIKGSRLNVMINLKYIKDIGFVEHKVAEVSSLYNGLIDGIARIVDLVEPQILV